MKPSELKKDGNYSGRINKENMKALKKLGISINDIIDAYIDATLDIKLDVTPKHVKS